MIALDKYLNMFRDMFGDTRPVIYAGRTAFKMLILITPHSTHDIKINLDKFIPDDMIRILRSDSIEDALSYGFVFPMALLNS